MPAHQILTLLTHVLAAYLILAAPWLGRLWYQRARKRIESGEPGAKVGLYRGMVVEQAVTTCVVLAIWRAGVPGGTLGLMAPRSWAGTCLAILIAVAALAWSSILLRPKAERLRIRLKDRVGALLPDTHQQRSWWAVVSVGAGVSEELCFRGFLLYYLATYLPHTNTWERLLLTSIVFGMAHVYQGWRSVIGTGVLGLIFAGLYVLTGSLLAPMVVHAAVDSRVLLIFPVESSPSLVMQSNA